MDEKLLHRVLLSAFVACTLLASSGCAVTRGQSTAGEYVDDATITTKVKAKFAEDATVSAMAISVETLQGVVQLSGFAKNQAEKDRAAQLASSTVGVKSVKNAIVVKS
ncbi:BON domain-containing protein [Solimonas soli]|uniref:BON domain-containing protein n=1 Tax=Solimonas soli TaxID=413479 RepID=UPI0004B27AFD|nr:BON domain-containing protein [Solimonas soli]